MDVKIEESWRQHIGEEFDKQYFVDLTNFVKEEYLCTPCYPPGRLIFNAFNLCPFDDVKVVIIGQDPYHEPGQAMGLSFSVPDGITFPPSLINIFKEIQMDLGTPMPATGDLTRWAKQGVLLLNATLTVRAHQAASHQRKGWEEFTDAAIKALSKDKEHLVFILWGGYARSKAKLIDTSKHLILEAVRKRPAMYIGDISEKGLHHLVNETVDNSIDEAMAGYCTDIEVTINEDNSITVEDNGRGIPVDMHEKLHKSALEVVMTVLHAGGKFDKGSYKVSGGLHGVGVSCVNALSTHMLSQVFRGGKIYQQEYEKGKPLYPVKVVGETNKRGTRQQFWPDPTIFTHTVYKWDIIANRMRELAFLNAGIKITLRDLRPDEEGKTKEQVFHAKDGLKELFAVF
jgi:uracil-DNA glycosylase